MSDLSNPTSRVLDVITLLAAQPTEEFSLAEIARQLSMSKASAHRLLLTMAETDFLARNDKHKTYSLGMGLLAVGQAALQKYRGLDVARAEMAPEGRPGPPQRVFVVIEGGAVRDRDQSAELDDARLQLVSDRP